MTTMPASTFKGNFLSGGPATLNNLADNVPSLKDFTTKKVVICFWHFLLRL